MPALATAAPPKSASPAFSPLYQQIMALLTRELQAGAWKPGQAIPSEQDLALRYGVSQGTVRKAIDVLAAENLVQRRQGKGTFVATHVEAQSQYRFLRLTPDRPLTPARTPDPQADGALGMARRLLQCQRQRAPADVARALGLKSGEAVVRLRRLLLSADRPVVLDDIWLPGGPFKGLSADLIDTYKGAMYGLFETRFGVHMVRAEEKIRAVAADTDTAGLLAVATGAPLLSVERLSFTYEDRPVELRRGLYRTEHFHYRNELA